jgi:acetyltransferase
MRIREIGPEELEQLLADLSRLLVAVVEGGASIGFVSPMTIERAEGYWRGVAGALRGGGRRMLVAVQGDVVMGTAQLDLATPENGLHRAEVMKVLVAPAARRRGIGRALMQAIEGVARREGRTLLLLDTAAGSGGEGLYRAMGWQEAGRVPGYALSSQGSLEETVIFYRQLAPVLVDAEEVAGGVAESGGDFGGVGPDGLDDLGA